jgi:hypothetical protein
MAEASTPDPFGESHTPGEPPPDVKRDQYGRYLIPHPDTGKLQAWTRVTTFAKTVADMYNIDLYHSRLVAKGMAMRPDLYAEASAAHIDDKKTLDRLCELAMEAAGKSAKARLGTALHAFTEKADRGEKQVVPAPWDADVKAYATCLSEHQVEVLPEYIEATVVVPKYGVAGTLDRLVRVVGSPEILVGDLKTGHSVQWAWLEIACQLFLYSQATHIFDHKTQTLTEFPKVDKSKAIVIHLPVGQAAASLYEVNLELGARVAMASDAVRELRKRKDFATPWSSSETGSTAAVFASGDDWDEAAEKTNAGDWDNEMSDTPAQPQPPAKKSAAKTAPGSSGPTDRGFYNLPDDPFPEPWVDLGIDPAKPRFQHVKSGKSQYLLVDIQTRGFEIYRLLREAKARRTEMDDSLLDPSIEARPVGAESGPEPIATVPEGDDWDASSDVEPKAEGDDWDVETAGPPPEPALKTQPPTPVTADKPAEEQQAGRLPGAEDDWDDDETDAASRAEAVEPAATDENSEVVRLRAEIARLRGETPSPAPVSTPEPAAKPPAERKWFAEIGEAGSEQELVALYKQADGAGAVTDRMLKAFRVRKAELLAKQAQEAAANTDWD